MNDNSQLQKRHPGRRHDDPKGMFRFSRARLTIFTTTGTLAIAGSFATWFLAQQYKDKERLVEEARAQAIDLAATKAATRGEVMALKVEFVSLKQRVDSYYSLSEAQRSEMRSDMQVFNDKLDRVMELVRGVGRVANGTKKIVAAQAAEHVVICHWGEAEGRNRLVPFTLTLPSSAATAHLRQHKQDAIGKCP